MQIHLRLEDAEYRSRLADRLSMRKSGFQEIILHHTAIQPETSVTGFWLVSSAYLPELKGYPYVLEMSETPCEEEGKCFCYQSVTKIAETIVKEMYRHQLVEVINQTVDTSQIIYLYSPFGGIGVSELSYQLAQTLGRNYKTLLLSMDAYHRFTSEFLQFSLSDYLYYWESIGKPNVSDFCYRQEGLDILHGPKHPQDLEVLKGKRKADFLDGLKRGGYERIVVDLSSSGMEFWFRPKGEEEIFLVVKKLEEKWKQFVSTADWDYREIPAENAFSAMKQILKERGWRC